MRLFAIVSSMLLSFNAFSATVRGAKLNQDQTEILVSVRYAGGCKEHVFEFKMGKCFETIPVKCSARLADKTTSDFCEAFKLREVRIPLKQFGLTNPYYSKANLTIYGDDDSSATVTLPE